MNNNQNGFIGNQQAPLNVIPQSQPENFGNNINQGFNNTPNNEITRDSILNSDEIRAFQSQNKFITENQANTSLNDLNVEGDYNGLPKVDYRQDPKVIENIQSQNKKNTITITGEAKVFLIIIAVLLLFTFVMPTIFDYINDIQN